jgi:hypothetical protein
LNNRSHGENFSSTSGQPEIVQEKREELRFESHVQQVNNRSHWRENFSSTSGQAELITQQFFENPSRGFSKSLGQRICITVDLRCKTATHILVSDRQK